MLRCQVRPGITRVGIARLWQCARCGIVMSKETEMAKKGERWQQKNQAQRVRPSLERPRRRRQLAVVKSAPEAAAIVAGAISERRDSTEATGADAAQASRHLLKCVSSSVDNKAGKLIRMLVR